MSIIIKRAKAIVRTYGFTIDTIEESLSDEEWLEIGTPEASFFVNERDGKTEVVMWTGSWPFMNDHPMGTLPSLEEAARYASWLLAREAFYSERDERLCDEAYKALKDRLVEQGCDGCDQDPWTEPVHYGSCPLAPKESV